MLIFVGRDLYIKNPRIIECDDGSRQSIDIRDFAVRYSAYSVELAAGVGNKARFSGKLNPVQLQELSEALQHANEFRKFLVVGYNSCAISKQQFAQHGATFQAMDSLSRQIDSIMKKPDLTQPDRESLSDLVKQYIELSQKLGAV